MNMATKVSSIEVQREILRRRKEKAIRDVIKKPPKK